MDDNGAEHRLGERFEEPRQRHNGEQHEHCGENARHLRLLSGSPAIDPAGVLAGDGL